MTWTPLNQASNALKYITGVPLLIRRNPAKEQQLIAEYLKSHKITYVNPHANIYNVSMSKQTMSLSAETFIS